MTKNQFNLLNIIKLWYHLDFQDKMLKLSQIEPKISK
jgi:hypothetical protein